MSSPLADDVTDPIEADSEWPFPELPEVRVTIGGEENDLRLADKILKRNIPDIGAAVGGIVPVVTHHEIMAFGYEKHRRVVQIVRRIALEDGVTDAVGQRFAKLWNAILTRAVANAGRRIAGGHNVIVQSNARHLFVVDVKNAVLHLDPVARQTHQPLDVVGGVVTGEFEHDDIAARWLE